MPNKKFKIYLKSVILGIIILLQAQASSAQPRLNDSFANAPNDIIEKQVVDQHKFYGLARYYNSARFVKVGNVGLKKIKPGEITTLDSDEWLAITGRFNILAVKADGLSFSIENDKIVLNNPEVLGSGQVDIVQKHKLKAHASELDKIRYSHLFFVINWLARGLEAVLVLIHSLVKSWGLAIFLISLLIKLVMLPLGRVVKRYQREVSRTQAKLAPRLAEIKATYKGEQAHKHFILAHKEAGVTTFYTLKPMIGLIVQVPVWIAIFNVLAEMPQISGSGFLWINDLAYPDAIASWFNPIPLLGDTFNLMPLLMTAVTIVSTISFQDKLAPAAVLKKQKRNLFFMAAAFLILFFPFPSGMVFYWTLANLLNAIQQIWSQQKNT